jgi:hypothetical protein
MAEIVAPILIAIAFFKGRIHSVIAFWVVASLFVHVICYGVAVATVIRLSRLGRRELKATQTNNQE